MGTDDLDGVLVGTYGTVGTQSVELALGGSWLHDGNFPLDRQGLEGDVVHDTDGEVGLRLLELEVVEYGNDLCRSGVLGRKTVAASDDERRILLALEKCLYIEVERLSESSWFLGPVEDSDPLDSLRKHLEEILGCEWTIEVYGDEAVVPALLGEEVDRLLDGLGDGTHGHDDVLGVRSSVICERTVLTSGQFADLAHVAGNDVRYLGIYVVPGLCGLEIDVAVLGGTAGDRGVRIEGPVAESLE